jgi:hypothetical protein
MRDALHPLMYGQPMIEEVGSSSVCGKNTRLSPSSSFPSWNRNSARFRVPYGFSELEAWPGNASPRSACTFSPGAGLQSAASSQFSDVNSSLKIEYQLVTIVTMQPATR